MTTLRRFLCRLFGHDDVSVWSSKSLRVWRKCVRCGRKAGL